MASEFLLEILTPERSFFCESIVSVIFPTEDGQMSIQKGHESEVATVVPGEVKINTGKKWLMCSVAEGFLEVRPDETIMFTPLNEKEIEQIVAMQLKGIEKLLASNGVKLDITPAALAFVAKEGYDPQFGARPVKRIIHRYILNQLSKDLLAQKVDKSKPIVIDADENGLVFRN